MAITPEALEVLLDRKLQPITSQLESLIDSVNFMSAKYEELCNKVQVLDKTATSIVQENKQLKAEVFGLTNKLTMCKDTVNNLDQYTRRECIEITGIPELPDEDTSDLTIEVGKLMGFTIKREDISISHRLAMPKRSYSSVTDQGGRTQVPKIIVKFVRRESRDRFYNGRKHLKGKTTKDMGFTRLPESRIYISESLSPRNREVFKQCLSLKRELKYKFIWTQYGRIYLRKDPESPSIMVSNQKDLDRLQQEISG